MRVKIKSRSRQTRYTIAIDTGIYAVDDLMGGGNAITPVQSQRGTFIVSAINVVDLSLQNSPMLIVFYADSSTSPGTNNNPINISDVSLRSLCRGVVPIGSADYTASASNSFANKSNLNIVLPSNNLLSPGFFIICKGTPTYAATVDLSVIIHGYVE